jgi:hypothetical protein
MMAFESGYCKKQSRREDKQGDQGSARAGERQDGQQRPERRGDGHTLTQEGLPGLRGVQFQFPDLSNNTSVPA